ncbi:MAG: DNA translocase FtsK, partial [Stackebrandtia sp.]
MAGRKSAAKKTARKRTAPARKRAASKQTGAVKKRASTRAATAKTKTRRRGIPGPFEAAVMGLRALWNGAARGVGWLARSVGREAATARAIDPAHRRDGVGLAVLGLAIILAVALWFERAGPVGVHLSFGMQWLLGISAFALPVLFGVGGVRIMRKAGTEEAHGRALVGWTTLYVGAVGLLHLANGLPEDSESLLQAGGHAGWVVGSGLDAAVSTWVAAPLLVLVVLFGVLVVTATPVNQVPARLARLWRLATGTYLEEPAARTRPRVAESSADDDYDEADEFEAEPEPEEIVPVPPRPRTKKATP